MQNQQVHKRKPSTIILDTVKDYFSPWTDIYRKENDKCHDDLEKTESTLKIISNAICYNQERLVQYIFLSTEKHKILKKAYENYKTKKGKEELSELESSFDGLYRYVQDNFNKATKGNFLFLQKYFEGRGEHEPRITVRGKSRYDGKEILIPLLKNYNAEYSSSVDIKTSTAYKHIQKTGLFFLENDIPRAIAMGKYVNNRIDLEKVDKLLTPFLEKGETAFSKKADELWEKCWHHDQTTSTLDKTRYYKSTLIIPITLSNNELDHEFILYLNEKINNTDITSNLIERTIFGFLCFDHIERGFFAEKNDISVAYQFADLISLYLFIRTMLVEISGTFSNVYNELTSKGRKINLDPYTYVPVDEIQIKESMTESKNNFFADIYKYESKQECQT